MYNIIYNIILYIVYSYTLYTHTHTHIFKYVIYSNHNNRNLSGEHTELFLFYPGEKPAHPAPFWQAHGAVEFSWAPFPSPALAGTQTHEAVTPPESRQPLALPSDLLNCHFPVSTISTVYLLERKLPHDVKKFTSEGLEVFFSSHFSLQLVALKTTDSFDGRGCCQQENRCKTEENVWNIEKSKSVLQCQSHYFIIQMQ